ncbi:MAG TPA: hypothetical protein VEA40_05765 [Ramlibacter sp.]|nr:hypothetical protein [Ramlibacter sp.]
MGFLDRLLGKPDKTRHGGHSIQFQSTREGVVSPQSVRKELVRVATRDALLHNGIPGHWIKAEPLTQAATGREPGVHVRLAVQHWDPRLMHHAVALQQNLERRIHSLDPMADQWLMGISWQFALQDTSACPPLPHPGSWTAAAAEPVQAAAAKPAAAPTGGSADVISGPTRITTPPSAGPDARKDLERLLAERDAEFENSQSGSFAKTQPLKL